MQKLLLTAAISLLSRLDLFAIAQAAHAASVKKIPPPVLSRIEELVRFVDDLDLPGEEKFRQVVSGLKDPAYWAHRFLPDIPQQTLLSSIQSAYESMRNGR
ncbi:MAG: hypothetical protein HC888_12350 [Candidatus Competibacteraceae bacterium]|nr:hypothetical protein [Candidatus Competibacteraceae bacterium]